MKRVPSTVHSRDPRLLAAVFAGGCAGAILRSALAETFTHDPSRWPWVTFAVNLAGAFVLGAVAVAARKGAWRLLRPLLGTGFCGALTTFATLQLEVLDMIDDRHLALAAGYVAASLAGGLAAVSLGGHVARKAA